MPASFMLRVTSGLSIGRRLYRGAKRRVQPFLSREPEVRHHPQRDRDVGRVRDDHVRTRHGLQHPLARALRPGSLVLSGGGARGVAHIGALRALEEAGIPIDAIAANSMGSIIGGIYATGQDARQLEKIVRSLDWAALFSGRADRRLRQE